MTLNASPIASTAAAPAAPRKGRPREALPLRVAVLKRPVKGETLTGRDRWTCIYVSGKALSALLPLTQGGRLDLSEAIRASGADGVRVPAGSSYSAAVLAEAKRRLLRGTLISTAAEAAAAALNNNAWEGC